MLYQSYRHILGHGDTHPARSHPAPWRYRFNRTISRRLVYCNWWKGCKNRHSKSISHYCKYYFVELSSVSSFCSGHRYTWDSIPLFRLQPTFQEPDIQIDDAALDSWKLGQLANAETLLTVAVNKSRNPSHDALASRALVRARLRQWDIAIADATEVFVALLSRMFMLTLIHTKSIIIQPSTIGYIAKSVALVGIGEKHKAYRACDIAFVHSHPSHVNFLLLIKVCIPCARAWLLSGPHVPRLSSCLQPESTTMRYPA